MITSVFWLGFIFLFCFTYLDLEYHKLDNFLVMLFIVIGILVHIRFGPLIPLFQNLLPTAILMLVTGIIGYTLWYFKAIGGGDAKLLIGLVAFLPYQTVPNMIGQAMFFFLEFAFIGLFYGLLYSKLFKSKGYIPFMPAITLTFLVSWYFQIH